MNVTNIPAQVPAKSVTTPVRIYRDFYISAARGRIEGHSVVQVIGQNQDIDSGSTPEDIWQAGGLYTFQSSAVAMQAISDSVNDASAGTGLRTMQVTGLGEDWVQISEIVTLNGTSPVALQNTYRRINEVVGVTCGAGGANAGTILVRTTSGAVAQAHMAPGDGISHQAIYTIPAGYTGFLVSSTTGMSRPPAGASAEVRLYVRDGSVPGPWIVRANFVLSSDGGTIHALNHPMPLTFPHKTDLRVTCTYASSNDVSITVNAEVLLIRNDIDF